MDEGPLFRRWFHEELAALDGSFEEGVRRGELPFGTEDPDVRRIVEAMAMFAARTRASAAASMRTAIVRMAGGLLDDLFAPMPAVAMLQADGARLLDVPADLPEGTRFRVETQDGLPSVFTTRRALSVRPITLEKAEIVWLARGAELRLRLAAAVPQKGALDLPLFVRRHGDARAAAEVFEALSRCFLGATARREGGVDQPCGVTFGAPAPQAPWEQEENGSPLGRIRSFFHAPEQDLFVTLALPAVDGAWKRLDVTLALSADLPESTAVSQDTFLLFVVPAENAWSDLAEPIDVDGTAEATPMRSAQSALPAVEPVRVRGVYRAGGPAGSALSPVPPRSLSEEGAWYEVLFPEAGAPLVRVHSDDAAVAPWKAHVDAVWAQPTLWRNARGPLVVKPQRKRLEGVAFRVLGQVRPPTVSPLALAPERGLDVLALRQKPSLDRADLRALTQLLGASGASPFARFPARIAAVDARWALDPLGSSGPRRRVYRLQMEPPPLDEEGLAPLFHRQVTALLDAWAPEAVEVETTTLPATGSRELAR
ncbi:type VI secretion system baseplate subunit TssF [Sorangium sp. So ce327]|uniref:type VI secretion system baseplate subunit TssF n=1 Tax=Sorangium sp. So ce327 TaxID=3133301 RepID=UPI003F63E9D9